MHPRHTLKRILDIELAIVAIVLAAPLMFALGWLVRRHLGTPVLFQQPRPGLQGRLFNLVKFRTMTDLRDSSGTLLPDEARMVTFGRWLRSTSLDELPELINVLRGDMSLVGPRPLLKAYLERYSPRHARRHEVRPGVTGWAQVHGRNDTSWQERLEHDVWYVDHWTLWLDTQILVRTVGMVLGRRGVSAPGSATMPEFTGAEDETR